MSKSKPESPSCKKGDADKPGETVKECPRGQLVVNVKDSDGKPVKDVDVNAGIWGAKKTDRVSESFASSTAHTILLAAKKMQAWRAKHRLPTSTSTSAICSTTPMNSHGCASNFVDSTAVAASENRCL